MARTAGDGSAVLVVGAGPTGLLLAAELQRRGVPHQLIDSRAEPTHWDRATVVHPRSLEVFESLGLAQRFLDAGTPQRGAKLHSDGQVLGAFDLTDCGSSYPFSVGVSEEVTESILTDYLHDLGGEVTRSSRLVGLHPGLDGVRAEIERDGERVEVDAAWVVGCDGLHSLTRGASGIGFDGHDLADPWAVFDVTLVGWPEVFDLTFVYFDAFPVVLTALPGRRWRAYVRPRSTGSDLVADAAVTLHAYYPDVQLVDVENPARFHCHTKVATRYRSGRVLLAGDAAHLCSPAQGHGMNTGLQDAANLGWKLALVHHGVADAALLDSYEVERRPPAERVGRYGDEFEHNEMLTDPVERAARNQDLRAMIAEAGARHHEVVAEAELDVEYTASPIVTGDAEPHLAPGQRLPDTIAVEAAAGRLHELTRHAGHTLLLLGGPTAAPGALADLLTAVQKLAADSPLFDAAAALGAGPEPPPSIQPPSTGPTAIGHLDPAAAERLGVVGVTLLAVRPDGYVGLRADRDHADALARYESLVRAGHS